MFDFKNVLSNFSGVQVQAHWAPIADSSLNLHNESLQHIELFNLSPSYPVKEYKSSDFEVCLPSSPMMVGDIWELDGEELVAFLHQFHSGATVSLIHGEEGAFACLRALSLNYAEITFRVHAEFVLESLAHQEWQQANSANDWADEARFIPGQFVGQLIINLKTGSIRSFSLRLPSRNSNVDINAFQCADMVYVPRMELIANDPNDRIKIAWDSEITEESSHRMLELKFYKFAEIDWMPIDEAVTRSKTKNLPIHAILLWGVLSDESC